MINLYLYFFYMMILSILIFFMSMFMYLFDYSIICEWLIFSVNSINMEFLILLDWLSCLFIMVVLMISSMIMLYSKIYMGSDLNIDRFIKLVILFIFSMILMIISPNLVSILFGWDGLGLTSFCLVVYYQNYMSLNSGMVTVLCNRVGDVGLMMSVGMVFSFGSWNVWMYWNFQNILIMMMIMISAMTKSAQIPFSVWLPMAMAAPTPVSALVHSSTLVTAGVYLMIRFNNFLVIFKLVKEFLLFISVFTMFMAGLMAILEVDLKKIIALSTLSQLGLMMMTLSLGLSYLSFFHLLTHAVFKSLLFMCAGIMIHLMSNNQDIRFYGKLNEFIPFTMMSFYISSMALMGFPFLAGFYSKDLIMEMVYMMNYNMFILNFMLISVMLTIIYSLRLMFYMFFSNLNSISLLSFKENSLMNLSMMVLLAMSIISGSMFFWLFFYDLCFIFLKVSIKMMTMIFMFMGVILVMYLYMYNFMKIYLISVFLSSMWMLNLIYMWIYSPVMNLGDFSYKFDKQWVEILSKNLLINFIKNLKLINSAYSMNMFLFLMLIMFIMVFLFF